MTLIETTKYWNPKGDPLSDRGTPDHWLGTICVHYEITDTVRSTTLLWYRYDVLTYNHWAAANGWPQVIVKS